MVVAIVFIILALALFGAAFFTRRRFGLLGLALTAGYVLSSIWNTTAGLMVSATGIVPRGPMTDAVTLSILVLLPAVILLFHGTTYKNDLARFFGAVCFAGLALAFLVEPISHALVLDGVGAQIYNWITANRDLIISIGIILAVLDLFTTKPAAKLEKELAKKKK